MKKTLLAAALAVGFAGVAQAETSVTLYGIVDTGIGYTQFKDKANDIKESRTGLYDGVQSGNRWGLKGSEDLGDGLKAVFQLESGFTLTDGNGDGRMFQRHASLGLASDSWGTVRFGRQENIASQFLGGIASPFGNSFAEAAIGKTFRSMNTVRVDNAVTYVTPSFSGFQLGLGYSFGTDGQEWDLDNADDESKTLITAGLKYANGPLAVGASYDRLDSDAFDKAIQAWNIAGSYDFEVVKLHLAFGQERDGLLKGYGHDEGITAELAGAARITDLKTNNINVGLSAPVGENSKVMANWATSRSAGDFKDAVAKKNQNLYSLGYTYDLSKRTNLYAVATYGTGYAFQDVNVTQAIIGLRHQF